MKTPRRLKYAATTNPPPLVTGKQLTQPKHTITPSLQENSSSQPQHTYQNEQHPPTTPPSAP